MKRRRMDYMAGKEKGEFGYLNYRKKLNLIKMIVSFAVVAAFLNLFEYILDISFSSLFSLSGKPLSLHTKMRS